MYTPTDRIRPNTLLQTWADCYVTLCVARGFERRQHLHKLKYDLEQIIDERGLDIADAPVGKVDRTLNHITIK